MVHHPMNYNLNNEKKQKHKKSIKDLLAEEKEKSEEEKEIERLEAEADEEYREASEEE